jgi:hypothetical protein
MLQPKSATEITWWLLHWNTEKCNKNLWMCRIFSVGLNFSHNLTRHLLRDFDMIFITVFIKSNINHIASWSPTPRKVLCAPKAQYDMYCWLCVLTATILYTGHSILMPTTHFLKLFSYCINLKELVQNSCGYFVTDEYKMHWAQDFELHARHVSYI